MSESHNKTANRRATGSTYGLVLGLHLLPELTASLGDLLHLEARIGGEDVLALLRYKGVPLAPYNSTQLNHTQKKTLFEQCVGAIFAAIWRQYGTWPGTISMGLTRCCCWLRPFGID